jgi:hypothetical protein
MSTARASPVNDRLVIVATSAGPARWLGDAAGHLVPKAGGALRRSRLARDDRVECGLGRAADLIHLAQARQYPQTELAAGPTCAWPMPQLPPEERSAKVRCNASEALVTGAPSRPTSGWSRRGTPRGSGPALI